MIEQLFRVVLEGRPAGEQKVMNVKEQIENSLKLRAEEGVDNNGLSLVSDAELKGLAGGQSLCPAYTQHQSTPRHYRHVTTFEYCE